MIIFRFRVSSLSITFKFLLNNAPFETTRFIAFRTAFIAVETGSSSVVFMIIRAFISIHYFLC